MTSPCLYALLAFFKKSINYPIISATFNLLSSERCRVFFCLFVLSLDRAGEPGEMAQRLRALDALPEVLSSIPSNHMVAHNPDALFWYI